MHTFRGCPGRRRTSRWRPGECYAVTSVAASRAGIEVGWLGAVSASSIPAAVALDGVGEFRQVAVADHAAELPLGFEHPGRGPAQRHVAGLPVLDVAGA